MPVSGADLPVRRVQHLDEVSTDRVIVAPKVDPTILESSRNLANQLIDPGCGEHRREEDP
jgi:hypothetical protein